MIKPSIMIMSLPSSAANRRWISSANLACLFVANSAQSTGIGLGIFFARYHHACTAMKNWIPGFASLNSTPINPANWMGALGFDDRQHFPGTIVKSAGAGIGFWVTLLYSTAVVCFGIDRIRRRKTPYVKLQTISLMLIQVFPLFLNS